MEHNKTLRILGIAVFTIGVVLAYNPELVSSKPVPESTFEAVERRIWWGLMIGVGLLLVVHHRPRPWLLTVAATGAALMLGLLIARLMGIAIDGSVIRQWYWVGVELALLLVFGVWYAKQK